MLVYPGHVAKVLFTPASEPVVVTAPASPTTQSVRVGPPAALLGPASAAQNEQWRMLRRVAWHADIVPLDSGFFAVTNAGYARRFTARATAMAPRQYLADRVAVDGDALCLFRVWHDHAVAHVGRVTRGRMRFSAREFRLNWNMVPISASHWCYRGGAWWAYDPPDRFIRFSVDDASSIREVRVPLLAEATTLADQSVHLSTFIVSPGGRYVWIDGNVTNRANYVGRFAFLIDTDHAACVKHDVVCGMNAAAFTPDGSRVLIVDTATGGGVCRVYDLATMTEVRAYAFPQSRLKYYTSVAVSPDGLTAALWGWHSGVLMFDLD